MEAEKAGLYVTYRLADPRVGAFLLDLRRLAESRLAEIQQITRQFLEARGALEPVDNDELVRRVRGGEVTLIDVRPREEYVAGHIPGAISVPLADLPKRVKELQKRRDIVAYCRGPVLRDGARCGRSPAPKGLSRASPGAWRAGMARPGMARRVGR